MRFALVLGGTGFISSHCVFGLLDVGFEVTIVTRGRTPDPHGDRVKRITVNTSSSIGRKDFRKAIKSCKTSWDLVVDCICFDRSDARSVITTLQGRMRLYVMISTDSVYEVCALPQRATGIKEEDDTLLQLSKEQLKAKDGYGFDKWRCEHYFRNLASEHGVDFFPFVCLRLPDVVGEREFPKSRHFEYQVRVEKGITVKVPDSPRRLSFVYVKDVASAVLAVANAPLKVVCGQSFNIASTELITIEDYLLEIARFYQNKQSQASPTHKNKRKMSGIEVCDSRLFERARSSYEWFPSVECGPLDNTKAKRMLLWTPTPFIRWLPSTCDWYICADNRSLLRSKVLDKDAASSSSDTDEPTEN